MTSVYDFEVKKTNGDMLSLNEFKGQPLIIVNTASKCGFASQFADLQALYEEYSDRGLMILGFPSDQFNQEFDDADETTEFCQINYGVTFPMLAKVDVNGDNAEPLFEHLVSKKQGMLSNKIKWNFTKFLVDRHGEVVKRYAPQTNPEKMKKDLEEIM